MRQQQIQQKTGNSSEFRVIRGFLSNHASHSVLPDLVTIAWTFAQSTLWNCQQFSSREIDEAKVHIANFIRVFRNPRKGFSVFCQRIILASNFLKVEPCSQLHTLPSVFLDRKHEHGFAFTKGLFKDICALRERLPCYEREIRALAEAVLEYSETPSRKNHRYWKNYFIEREKPELLNLFQLFMVNFLYTK